ncbi:MAG: transcriptional regulator [Leptolyngbyaceae cyanobacterium SL_7_1]|nr:transcriptional regulator [Leptolyngbyaceae cyanobacterium SL_7_1]
MEAFKPKVKAQILHLLKMQGAQTAIALAHQLQVSPMAVRQHLQQLKTKQLVTYQEERRPVGRPVKLWQLTAHSTEQFPDSHAELLVDLLQGIESMFGREGLEKLVWERSHRQLQLYSTQLAEVGAEDWQERLRAIAQFRTQEGYMAEVQQISGDAWLLIENHCPIQTAATRCQGLCNAELEVFRTLLGSAVTVERVDHLLQGDRRCAYQVKQLAVSD